MSMSMSTMLNINKLIISGLSSMIGNIVRDVIRECGSVHNFDASEMIRNCNLEDIRVSVSSNKKVVKEKVVKEKVVKEKVVKEKVVKEKKEKGRPKKPRREIELADDSTDLFALLVAKANEDSEEEFSSDESVKSVLDGVINEIETAEKEAAKQEKIQKKAEKEAAKLVEIQKKAEKEAAKQAEIQKKEEEKAEKDAAKQAEIQKKEEEKAEKEAAKQAEIQKKEEEKAEKEAAKQKIAELKAEMERLSKTTTKKSTKSKKESSDSETEKKAKPVEKKVSKVKVEEDEEVADIVKRFEYEGVKYLKSKNTGIVYNLDQDAVGKWNEKTSKIDFEEAGSEEEEDDYEA